MSVSVASEVEESGLISDLNGPSSAAVLLMAMGEENAAKVLQYMGPDEVWAVGEAMSEISDITQDQIGHTLHNFLSKAEAQVPIQNEPANYLSLMLEKALGKEKAVSVLSQINKDSVAPALDCLKWMPNQVIARLIQEEHPQFIAIVLSYLDKDKAAVVLEALPIERQTDILIRISKLESIQHTALKEIDVILEQRFGQNFDAELEGSGGVKKVAQILNAVSTDQETAILETLENVDSDLANDIRDNMFVFENLLSIEDRDIQVLLRDVTGDVLVKALKGAGQEIKAKFFKNISSRAAILLKDDLDAAGPMRLVEVESAQKEILATAQQLALEEKISLGGKNDEFV